MGWWEERSSPVFLYKYLTPFFLPLFAGGVGIGEKMRNLLLFTGGADSFSICTVRHMGVNILGCSAKEVGR